MPLSRKILPHGKAKIQAGAGSSVSSLVLNGSTLQLNQTNSQPQRTVDLSDLAGDITGVTAGDGLTGGGNSGAVTLAVGVGTGLDVSADAVTLDLTEVGFGGGANRLITDDADGTVTTEANLTFDGSTLALTGNQSISGYIGRDTHNYIDFGTDNVIRFRINDSMSHQITTSSSNVVFQPLINGKDIIFQQYDGNEVIRFKDNLDVEVAGGLTVTGDITGSDDVVINDDLVVKDNISLDSDSAVLLFGDDGEVNLTHVHDGGLILNSSKYLAFGSAATRINRSATGLLDITSNNEIELNATLVDINAAVDISGNTNIGGNLTVQGTTTTIDSTTLSVKDKNIEMGVVSSPTDVTADGGGITLKGTTDKTFNWVDSTDSWTSSEHIQLASGKNLTLNGDGVGLSIKDGDGTEIVRLQTASGDEGLLYLRGPTGGNSIYLDGNSDSYINNGANLGIGITSPTSKLHVKGTLDIQDGNQTILMGAGNSSTSRSNDTLKLARVGLAHYHNAEEAAAMMFASSNGTDNTVAIGGGTSGMNAATKLQFFTAANDATTEGTERMRITSDGKVGIGTSSPNSKMTVQGDLDIPVNSRFRAGSGGADTGLDIYFNNSDSNSVIENRASGGDLVFRQLHNGKDYIFKADNDSGTEQEIMRIDGSNARVGIGTNAPGAQLDIHQTADDTALEIAGYDDKSGVTAKLHVRSNGLSRFQGSTDAQVQSAAGSIYLSSTEHMYLDVGTRNTYSHIFRDDTGEFARFKNARLGIGTTAPDQKLHIKSDDNYLAKFESTDGIAEIRLQDNTKYTRLLSVGHRMKFMPNDGAEMFNLDGSAYRTTLLGESGGNSPKLTFDNPDASNDIQLTQGDAGWFGLSTDGGSTQHFIARTGNIGIGTESPAEKLDVAGNIRAEASSKSIVIDPYFVVSGDNQYSMISGSAGLALYPNDSYTDLWVHSASRSVRFRAVASDGSFDAGSFLEIFPDSIGATGDANANIRNSSGNLTLLTTGDDDIVLNSHDSLNLFFDNEYQMYSAADGNYRFMIRDASVASMEFDNSHKIHFKNATSTKMTVDTSNGRLGIGTTGPSYPLHINGAATQELRIQSSDSGAYSRVQLRSATDGYAQFNMGDSGADAAGGLVYTHSSDTLDIRAANAVQLSITDNLVTLGDGVVLAPHASDNFTIDSPNGIILDGTSASNGVQYHDGGTELLRINNSSSDVVIKTIQQDKDLIFKGNDGGSEITALTLDMAEAGLATFNTTPVVGTLAASDNSTKAASTAYVTAAVAAGGGGSSVSFGSDNQIPFTNSGGDDFDYSANLTFDGSTLIADADIKLLDNEKLLVGTDSGLQIYGQAGATKYITNLSEQLLIWNQDSSSAPIKIQATDTSNGIQFNIAGTEKGRFTSTGLGIGTTSPNSLLEIVGTNPKIIVDGGGSDDASIELRESASYGGRMYYDGDNNIFMKFTTIDAGTEKIRMAYDRDGNVYLGSADGSDATPNPNMFIAEGGNVGIGTSSPSTTLDIGGSGDQRIRLASTSANSSTLILASDGGAERIDFSLDGVGNMLSMTETGRIGIGTTSPSKSFQVAGTAKVDGEFFAAGGGDFSAGSFRFRDGVLQAFGTDRDVAWTFDNTNDRLLLVSGNSASNTTLIHIGADPTDGMYVAGSLGIGTTSPSTKLHVVGDALIDGYLHADKDGSPGLLVGEGGDADIYYDGTDMNINPKRVGSGVLKVLGTLDMPTNNGITFDNTNNNNQWFISNRGSNAATLVFGIGAIDNANAKITMDGDGDLGIGTMTPSEKLDVRGKVLIDQYLRLQRNTSTNGLNLTDSAGNAVPAHTKGLFAGDGFALSPDASEVILYKSTTGSASATAGKIKFASRNDAGTAMPYAEIEGIAYDDTASGEDGHIVFRTEVASTMTEQMRLSESGLAITGNLMFPDSNNTISAFSSDNLYLRAHNDMYFNIDTPNDSTSRHFIWRTNTSNELMRLGEDGILEVKSGGKVGIGTSAPSTALHLASATASEPVITIENTNADNNPPGLTFFKNTASPASSDQVGSIKFDSKEATSGDTKTYWEIQTRINDATNTTPNGQLNFYGLDGDSPGFIHQFQFINSQFSVLNSDGIGPTIAPTGTNGGMFKTQGNKMRLQAKSDSTGEIHMMANTVGIGTTSPQQALHVVGNITTNALDSEYRFGNRSDLLIRGHSDFDMELISPQDMAFSIDSDNNETAHKFLFKTNTTTPRSAGTTLMEISEAGDVSITGGLGVTGSTLAVQKEMKNDVSGDFTLSTSYSHYKVAALTGDAPTNITVTLTAPSSPRIGDEYTIVTECGDSPAANPGFANQYTATVRIIANTGQTINMVNTNININSIQSATLKYNMAKLICIDSNAFALIVSDIGPVA